jgi:beta-glucosidase
VREAHNELIFPCIRGPPDFLIGAATAGHQIEGGNVASDCWALEQVPDTVFRERSGDAVDFYHRWPQDVATAVTNR